MSVSTFGRVQFPCVIALTTLTPAASAQHDSDIILGLKGGAISTGVLPSGGTGPAVPERVFESEFGELLANWTSEPGFDSDAGAFAPGTEVGFDITKALKAWDGSAFSAIPPEAIRITKGALSIDTPAVDVVTPGYVFGSANLAGVFHHHLAFELLAPSSDGVYLLELALWSTSPAIGSSEPFWIVFGQNASPSTIDDAIDWVRANMIGQACYADCDGSGSLDFFDFLCFQNEFSAGTTYADCDASGTLDFFDFLCFQNEFSVGCQ